MTAARAIDQAISKRGHENTEVAKWLLEELKRRKIKLSKPYTRRSLAVLVGCLRKGQRLAFWKKNREAAQLVADRYGVAIEDIFEGLPAADNSIVLPEFPGLTPLTLADGPCALWSAGWLLDLAFGAALQAEGERRWIVVPAGWGKSLLVKWAQAVHGGATASASARTLSAGAGHAEAKVPLVIEVEEVGPDDKAALRALAGRTASTIVLAPFNPPAGPAAEVGSWEVQTLPEGLGWRARLLTWICDRLEREDRDTKLDAKGVQYWLDRYDPHGSLVASPGDLIALCADIDRESEGGLGERAHRWLESFGFRSLAGAGRTWGDGVGVTAFSGAVTSRFASLTDLPGSADAEAWARALPERTALPRSGETPGTLVAISYLREAGLLRGDSGGLAPFPRWVQQGLVERSLETELATESREKWGALAGDATRRAVVDRALDALDDERFRRLVRQVARQGPPTTMASTAAVEATFAAASRRLWFEDFAVPGDELSGWHELARLQVGTLVPCAGYWTGLHHPFTRRNVVGWLVDAWRFSFRLAAPSSLPDGTLGWELPGWFEKLELRSAPNLPDPSSFKGQERELAPLLELLAGRIKVTTVPERACPLLLPALFLSPAGTEWGLNGAHLELLASAWARTVDSGAWSHLLDSFPADRWTAAARRIWHLCPAAMKLPGANLHSFGVADRLAYLATSHPSLLPRVTCRLEWIDVETAMTTSGLLGEKTHTPLLALLPKTLFRRALETWVSRPPERGSQWFDAQELAPMLDAGAIDLVIGLVRHANKVAAEEFVRHVWRLAPGQAETAALAALHGGEETAATWFSCAPRASLPPLADAIEACPKAPSWLGSWAYERALDAGTEQERFFKWSHRPAS